MYILIIALIIVFILLIVTILGVFAYLKIRARRFLDDAGFAGMSLGEVIQEAKLEDQEVPKSLSSMDSIYLENIKRDFPSININEIKSQAEKIILDSYNAIEKKNSTGLKGKIKSFTDDLINDYKGKDVRFDNFKIHNTVVARYTNDRGVATITFGTSFEYNLVINGKSVKTQDRIKTEFIYVIDMDKVPADLKAFGINCPNCGSPIKNLGEKSCAYCGSAVKEIFGHLFTCNNIVRY